MNDDGNDKISGPGEGEQNPDEAAETGTPKEAGGADQAPPEVAAGEAPSGSDSESGVEPSSTEVAADAEAAAAPAPAAVPAEEATEETAAE